MQVYHTEAVALAVNVAGRIPAAATRNPATATPRRACFRSPDRRAQRSEAHPPSRSPAVPASSGKLAYMPMCLRSKPRCSLRYFGNQSR